MDSLNKYNLEPLPLEKELRVQVVRAGLSSLSRDQLEKSFLEALELVVKLTHQTKQLVDIIESLEGKLD